MKTGGDPSKNRNPESFKMKSDKIFQNKRKIGDFKFDNEVAGVFDDMLDRSVPFYSEMQRMIGELVSIFAIEGTNIYDLGCSTGNTILNVLKNTESQDIKVTGIDYSKSMLENAERKIHDSYTGSNYELIRADLNKPIQIKNASVVIMVLTLQFVRPLQREALIGQIYNNLLDNGCFILIEKVIAQDSMFNRMFIDLYYGFKKRMGYSKLEIAKKREALENVLIPLRIDENIDLLRRNGFSMIEIFFKWYNFTGIIGVKQDYGQ
jgi:tRNA (cmo5U34)-methyltransferase